MMASVLQDPAYYMAAYKRLSICTTNKAREMLLLQLNAAGGMLRQKKQGEEKPLFFFFPARSEVKMDRREQMSVAKRGASTSKMAFHWTSTSETTTKLCSN